MGERFVEHYLSKCDPDTISLGAGMNLAHAKLRVEQETDGACQPILQQGKPCVSFLFQMCNYLSGE